MIAVGGLDALKRRRPEWSPWLAVVEEALREANGARWEAAVPDEPGAREHTAPLLRGAAIVIDEPTVRRLLRRLCGLAASGGTPQMATLDLAARAPVDAAALFGASVCQDHDYVVRLADSSGADAEALQAVVALVSMPFLQACARRWAQAVPRSWIQGCCPICGSWPAFAEMRGIERSRYFRCARCGSAWYAQLLRCAYCGNAEHDDLVTLVPDKAGTTGSIEACSRCGGYVKVFTTLQGCPPETVMLEDLGSVDLDVAAIEKGFTRPSGPGCAMDVAVSARRPSRRFFGLNV